MEQVALRLEKTDAWTHLGGDEEAAEPPECVIRAFEQPIDIAAGDSATAPDTDPVRVPAGEGRRLKGRHFFARPSEPGRPCLISYRGI